MSVSGLVITLEPDRALAERSLRALADDPRLSLGAQFGRRLAAVADTPDTQADRALIDDLRALPGIIHVDVVFVSVDGAAPCPDDPPAAPLLSAPFQPRRLS